MKKLLVFLLILFISGCYNYQELNDLSIITAIGIDYDDKYKVSIQVVNTNQTSEDEARFTIYTSEGNTVEEALKNISLICPKKIILSHLEILIYGEKVAKKGIANTLDYFLRENESRGDFYVFIAKNHDAKEILKVITPNENNNAKNIKKMVSEAMDETGKTTITDFNELASNYLNQNKEFLIPSININGNEKGKTTEEIPNVFLKLDKVALFKDDKLIDYANIKEIIGYNILTKNIKETTISYKCNDGYINVLLNNFKTTIKVKENLEVLIKIMADGKISEVTCNIDLNDNINKINKGINKQLKKDIKKTLNRFKNNNTDIIGILDLYYKNNNDYYKLINNNWNDNFKKIKYTINTKVNINNTGNLIKVIK